MIASKTTSRPALNFVKVLTNSFNDKYLQCYDFSKVHTDFMYILCHTSFLILVLIYKPTVNFYSFASIFKLWIMTSFFSIFHSVCVMGTPPLLNPLSPKLNFRYLSYSGQLISRIAFFLVSIDYNCCFEFRGKVPDVESTCCVFLLQRFGKNYLY